jgi:hypothetical protein
VSRSSHYIRPNESTARPSVIVFLACDSEIEENARGDRIERFVAARVCVYRRRDPDTGGPADVRTFGDAGQTLDFICSQAHARSRTLVVSSNPIRDLTLLDHVRELAGRGYAMADPVSSVRFTAISYKRGSASLVFISHHNIFHRSNRLPQDPAARVAEMYRQWCDLLAMLDEHDCGDFKLSLGSQAMAIFRHRFMQHPILIHGNEFVDRLERKSAAGACYQPQFAGSADPGAFYYVDVNAMYPHCMRSFVLPWRLAGFAGALPVRTLEDHMQHNLCVATVRLRTESPIYPCRFNNRTVFPIGEFWTTLTTPDLWNALEEDAVREVRQAAWYDGERLFVDFVDYWWKARRRYTSAGEKVKAGLCKSWMVALYGRWGARYHETVEEATTEPGEYGSGSLLDADTGEIRSYTILAGRMISRRRVGLAPDAFPAIMAHVAAHARNALFEYADRAGRDHVYVYLSDGMIVDQAGYDRLAGDLDDERLGALKCKLSAETLETRSDVEYVLGDRRWLSGVKRDAASVEDGVYVEHRAPNLNTLLKWSGPGEYLERKTTIRQSFSFRSGVVTDSGWIEPFRLPLPPAL